MFHRDYAEFFKAKIHREIQEDKSASRTPLAIFEIRSQLLALKSAKTPGEIE